MRRRTALVLPALCITLSCVGRVQVDAPKPQASTPTAQDTAADVATDVTIEVNGRNVTVDGVQVAFLPNFGDGIDVAAFDTLALRLQEKSGGESPRSSPGSIRIKLWDGATVAQADVVVQAAVWQGYPNVTVDVAGKSRQFRAPSLAPAGAQSIQTQPKESVYVARVPAGIELTWLRQYRGGGPRDSRPGDGSRLAERTGDDAPQEVRWCAPVQQRCG